MSPVTNPYASGAITREIAEPLTSKEWLALAYLAVKAAEEARTDGNVFAEQRYTALARKCDHESEAIW
jgi:hypothetical protein